MADAQDINHSMDSRRVAKQQEKAFAESSVLLVSIVRPSIQYQAAITRLWADTLAVFATQYEKTADMMTSFAQQAQQQAADR